MGLDRENTGFSPRPAGIHAEPCEFCRVSSYDRRLLVDIAWAYVVLFEAGVGLPQRICVAGTIARDWQADGPAS